MEAIDGTSQTHQKDDVGFENRFRFVIFGAVIRDCCMAGTGKEKPMSRERGPWETGCGQGCVEPR